MWEGFISYKVGGYFDFGNGEGLSGFFNVWKWKDGWNIRIIWK